MKLHLHKYILRMVMGFFVISPSFVYAEDFRISLYPSKAEQVFSCVSFFAHKTSISDLTDEEYQKLVALAKYDLNIQTLPLLPNKDGKSQEEARFKRDKDLLEIVNLGISYEVYEEIFNFVKTSDDQPQSINTPQMIHEMRFQKNKTELEALKQQARELLLKYPDIIVDQNNLNLTNRDGETYLHLAAKKNIIELIEALLILNPNLIVEKDINDWTPLMLATYSDHDAVVTVLLRNGADPNLQMNDGKTALIWAAFQGHIVIVRILLENGADINLRNKDGKSALMLAAGNRQNDVIKTLLENGANPNLQDRWGMTALKWAAEGGNTEAEELLRAYGAK